MPIYNRICKHGHITYDCYETIRFTEEVVCNECGGPTERTILGGNVSNVIPDDIPGGVWIRHGLCNEDGSPKKYYSRSEIEAEAKKRELVNAVRHTPWQDSDKSPHTVQWISVSTISEEERLENWRKHEESLPKDRRLLKGD